MGPNFYLLTDSKDICSKYFGYIQLGGVFIEV